MMLSKQLACQIVEAVHAVVGNDINLINSSGIIIGSTNQQRIGTFHEAGYEVVKTGVPISVEEGHRFQGALNGINYPIFLEETPIAAIGITGNPEELKRFGFLITKITEVFLKEQQINEELISEKRSLQYLITSIIYDNIQNTKQMELLIKQYGINPFEEYAVLAIKMKDTGIEHSLECYFKKRGYQIFTYLYPNEWIVILDVKNISFFSLDDFEDTFKGKVVAGMGAYCTFYQLNRSYQSAQIARREAERSGQTFCNVEHLSIEFILDSIPNSVKTTYCANILKNLSEKEIHILNIYFSSGLSLKKTAEILFMHKNTLQYQLDRISEKIGLNPRVFEEAFRIQLALYCRKM